MVQRPNEVLLFRPPELGGLGLTNVYARATANLVKNFVEMGLRESKSASLYMNAIFRAFVCGEEGLTVKKPSFLPPEVFSIVKEAMQDSNILLITTRGWQDRITRRAITHVSDATSGICTMIETPLEESTEKREWGDMWTNSRCPGLSPENKSWLFKFCQDLLPTNVKLHKFRLEDSPNCSTCGVPDTRLHFLDCPLSNGVGSVLLDVVTASTTSKIQPNKEELSTLNFSMESHLVLPAMTQSRRSTRYLRRFLCSRPG